MPGNTTRIFTPLDKRPGGWRSYAIAAAVVGAVAALSAPLQRHIDPANLVMFFPLTVLFAAVRLGRGPAVLAAFLSVALFDFFFVAPHLTLAVSDLQYLVTFAVMLAVALVTAELATGLRTQRDAAEERERRTQALYEMARELSAALTAEQIAEIANRYVVETVGAHTQLVLPEDEIAAPLSKPADADGTIALTLPLDAPLRNRGLMHIRTQAGAPPISAEQRRLLETFATLTAIALDRVHYVSVAQHAQVEMASERLRNSLLGALSHDLRTPLTALVGLADTLRLTPPALEPPQAELADAIREEALRMSEQVNKLLDIARLKAGPVKLKREWQPLEEVIGTALQARARQMARHQLHLDLPADLPMVYIDAVLMERALCNLFENAAKFAPAGSTIAVTARQTREHIELSVADEGPGLPPGRSEELFARFSRGATDPTPPGFGLGLTIVQAVVEAHGGQVRATSRPSGGALFTIELPLGTPPALPEFQE